MALGGLGGKKYESTEIHIDAETITIYIIYHLSHFYTP